MKKTNTFGVLAMFLVAMFSFSLVLAEEVETDVAEPSLISAPTDEAVTVADDEVVSNFRYGWEKFKLNFVRNKTVRAQRELQLANWKVAEAKFAMRNGNVEKAEKAMRAHEAILARAQERISKMENKSLTPGLDKALKVHEERLANLNLVMESANLTESQRERINERIVKLENVSSHLGEVRTKVQERAQVRIEAMENQTERIQENGELVQERLQERVGKADSD